MSRVFLLSANTSVEPFPVYPLGMAAVARAMQRRGHTVRQFDPLVEGEDPAPLRAALREFAPDVVGISLRNIDNVDSFSGESAWSLGALRERVRQIREEVSAPVVIGGAGFSILPEAILEFLGADHGVVGPGEEVGCDLLDALRAGAPVPRIWTSRPQRDAKPIHRPAHDGEVVAAYLERGGLLGLSSKRGCPHACAYCTYPAIEGGAFVLRDPAEVADEVGRLQREFGAISFFFTDSVFNDPMDHYLSVAEEFCRRGLQTRWCAFFRPAGIGGEALALLKRSGLFAAELGTDAASDVALAGLCKGFSFADVVEVDRALSAQRIPCAHYVIFGGPGETEATLEEGLANLDRLEDSVVFAFSGIRLFPGTPLHRRAIAEGIVPADQSLLHPVYYFSPAVDREAMNRRIEAAFRGRPTRIFPPPVGQARAQQLRAMGFRGLLWDQLVLARWRRQSRTAPSAPSGE